MWRFSAQNTANEFAGWTVKFLLFCPENSWQPLTNACRQCKNGADEAGQYAVLASLTLTEPRLK
jgi:hypothetical protein